MDHSLDHQKIRSLLLAEMLVLEADVSFTHSWSFLYVKAAWLLRYTYLVTGVSASMPTLIFNARSTSAIIGRSK